MIFDAGWRRTSVFCAGLGALVGLLIGCSVTDSGREQASSDIQSRGMGRAQEPLQSASPGAAAQLPTFPQKFNVQGPETQTFGFAVTQPGPIVVDVQGQGAPLTVTLQSTGGQPTTQQATGNLRMNYSVTPQDVQKNLFWTVQIRLAQPMPPQQGGRAAGSVNVQHPPVNQATVQQAVQASAAQRRLPTDQEKAQAAAQLQAQMDTGFQAHKARFEQQEQQRRAAIMAELQSMLAQRQAQGAVRPRGVEENPSSEAAGTPGEDVTSRGLMSGTLMLSPSMVMPNPAVTSLSTKGKPGDSVFITGSGFGSNKGEVHFMIAPTIDKIATTIVSWSDTQIFAIIPDASGVVEFDGTVYIKRATDKVSSNLSPFHFVPSLELRTLGCVRDVILEQVTYVTANNCSVYRYNANWFYTPQGNDQLFVNSRLQNGWTVVQPPTVFVHALYSAGGAYLVDSRVGTNSPYVNVRFWVNPGSFAWSQLMYGILIPIQGPKGVADGLVSDQTVLQ